MASRKIKSVPYFEGDLIIICEGLHILRSKQSKQENALKFWLPEQIPSRVKLIITTTNESYNLDFLSKLPKTKIIQYRESPEELQLLLQTLNQGASSVSS